MSTGPFASAARRTRIPLASAQLTYIDTSSATNAVVASAVSCRLGRIAIRASRASSAARPRRAAAEHMEPTREHADELARMGASRWAEACCQAPRGRRRRDEAVEVLNVAQHCPAVVRLPEAGFAHPCKGLLLQPLARLDLFRNALELPLEERGLGRRSLGIERDSCEREAGARAAGRLGGGVVRVRIDERDVELVAVSRRDEEELVSFREAALDDRRGEAGQQVLLDRALQRPGAELGAEALLDQEVDQPLRPIPRPTVASGTRGASAPRSARARAGCA